MAGETDLPVADYSNTSRTIATFDFGDGKLSPFVALRGPATGTQSNVSASASDVTILASNALRRGASVFNDSTALLYLLLASATSSTTVHSVQVKAGGYFEVPFGYTGIIKGIWASATGAARIMEYT